MYLPHHQSKGGEVRSFALIVMSLILSVTVAGTAGAQRRVIDISTEPWGLWLDREAEWVADELYLPPVDVAGLPVNEPTCGWDALAGNTEVRTPLPATVEQFFWGENGNLESVGGDYRGVSWWFSAVDIPADVAGQQLFLDFEAVHLRAEVFVNRQLCGYDLVGGTPFSVDVTDAVVPGASNDIAVRITDPLGNFNWNDRAALRWGGYDVPAGHGFGGITGHVYFRAVDDVRVDDVFVINTPNITSVDVFATMQNVSEQAVNGTLAVTVHDSNDPGAVLWDDTREYTVPAGETVESIHVEAPDAILWSLDEPQLYTAAVSFVSGDGAIADTARRRFGFRWFGTGERDGDRRLYLNGKRIVLRGAMTWGFWPVNGAFATPQMARRDVAVAKELGLTYMNYHRAIGQPRALDAADEMGLLTYEEPGGYSCEGADPGQDFWRDFRRIRLMRMVKRDRSRPSLIMYNLQNRTPNPLTDDDLANMRAAHELDPSRVITFISGFWEEPPREAAEKLYFEPFDMTEHYTGWYDMHNHARMNSYGDHFYNAPDDYARYHNDPGEIVFWGEDGNIYSPPRVQLIREWYDRNGGPYGWQGRRFVEWFDAYDHFLDTSGFREFFPDVESFTRSMGNTTLYYHGRIIENVRIGNTGDAYTINGWAAPRLANQSEVADLFRNPSGDSGILARYCRPLYVAVKLRNKLVRAGDTLIADIWLVNEENVSGRHSVTVTLSHESGDRDFRKILPVRVTGGETYGQLLVEGVEIPLDAASGYFTVRAELRDRRGRLVTDGDDTACAVSLDIRDISGNGALIDASGTINGALSAQWGITLPLFDDSIIDPHYILIGPNELHGAGQLAPILHCVANGATAIVLDGAERFAELLAADDIQALAYYGSYPIGAGKLIAGRDALLDGLPQAQACGWEYQAFNRLDRSATAMRLSRARTVIAGVSGNQIEVGDVLCEVAYGRGSIILSGLPIVPWLGDDDPAGITARRLLGNLLVYGSR